MPPSSETSWWRGKKGFEVGFFPGDCVELIGGKPRPKSTLERPISKKSQTEAATKHNKLRAFLSHFFRHRPSRVQLKQSGIIGERVFGCDLGEYLLNTAMLVPHILKLCTKEIELHGVIDGIYRLSGSALKVQKLREEFDRCEKNEFTDDDILDIHAISSVLKTYFRELPIPLLTFQFYPQLVAAIQKPDTDEQVSTVKSIIEQLSPPHYRTSSHLFGHLNHLALMSKKTGMTSRNLAIVWAPNLMRHSDGKSSSAASDGLALLQNISLQAAVVDLLITNFDTIFNQKVQTDLKSFGKKTLGRPYAGRLITLVVARRQRTNEHLLYSTKKDKYGSLNKSKSSSAESFFESTSKAKKVHLLPAKKVQKAESCAVDDDAYMSTAEPYVGTLTRDPSINRPMSDLTKDPQDLIGTIKGKLTESRSFNPSIGNSLAMETQTGNRPHSMASSISTRGTVAKGLEHPYGLVNMITTKFESEGLKIGMETAPTPVFHTSAAENISSDFSREKNTKGPMPLPKPRQPRRPHDYVNVELNKSIPCETGQRQVTESRLKPVPSVRTEGKTTSSDDETKTLTPSCVVTLNCTTDDDYVVENPGFLRNTFPGHCTGTPQSQSVHQQLKLAFSNPKSDDDAIILPSHLHLSVDSL